MLQRHFFLALLGVILTSVVVALLVQGPIPQPDFYHDFADKQMWFSLIPNGSNVVSNAGFLLVGLWGLYTLAFYECIFEYEGEKRAYWMMFASLVVIAVGSAYYHWAPTNETLFWDRLPMTVMFMTILSILLSEKVDQRMGALSLVPLITIGVLSLLYWIFTELHDIHVGDLRAYILVQAAPIILTPFLVFMYEDRYTLANNILYCCGLYILSKLTETFDHAVYRMTFGWISGHALKHLLGAFGAMFLVPMVRHRELAKKIT